MTIFSFKKMVSTLTIRLHIKKVCLGNHGTITLFVVSLNFCGYNINNELPVNFFFADREIFRRGITCIEMKSLLTPVYSYLINI